MNSPLRMEQAIFATTDHLEAYGGFQLSKENLIKYAKHFAESENSFSFNHDPTQPMRMRILRSGVRERLDGEFEGWFDYEIHEEDWDFMQSNFKEAGAKGGISITVVQKIYRHGEGINVITLSGDASNWTEDELLTAIDYGPIAGSVQVNQLYQFAVTPVAQLALTVLSTVSLGVVSNLLTDLVRKSKTKPVYAKVIVKRSRRKATIVFKTSSEKSINKFVSQLPDILRSGGSFFNLGDLDEDEKN